MGGRDRVRQKRCLYKIWVCYQREKSWSTQIGSQRKESVFYWCHIINRSTGHLHDYGFCQWRYFLWFCSRSQMLPFPHPKSILIMDNCSIHHIEHVTTLIEEAGILLLFLPPYSPDLNPIECVFGFVKGYLKEYEHISCAFPDSRVLLKSAFEHDMCILFVPENRLYHV